MSGKNDTTQTSEERLFDAYVNCYKAGVDLTEKIGDACARAVETMKRQGAVFPEGRVMYLDCPGGTAGPNGDAE